LGHCFTDVPPFYQPPLYIVATQLHFFPTFAGCVQSQPDATISSGANMWWYCGAHKNPKFPGIQSLRSTVMCFARKYYSSFPASNAASGFFFFPFFNGCGELVLDYG